MTDQDPQPAEATPDTPPPAPEETATAPPPADTHVPAAAAPVAATAPPQASASDQNQWAMWVHISTLSQWIGVPFGGILGPLILWLVKKDTMPAVDAHGKEALNFQISMLIYFFAISALIIPIALFTMGLGIIAMFPVLIAFVVFEIWVTVLAAMAASAGNHYRYPLAIRLIV